MENLKKFKKIKCSFLFLLSFTAALMVTACKDSVSYSYEDSEDVSASTAEKESYDSADEAKGEIYVSILGEVLYPGVYVLEEGSRMFEAINIAGGVTDNADLTGINLVGFAEDGMQIVVPGLNDSSYVNNENAVILTNHDGKVNINTADSAELKTIPGIGDTRAGAIVEYRNKNGKFKSIEDIMNVSGIKNNTFESIKDYIYAE